MPDEKIDKKVRLEQAQLDVIARVQETHGGSDFSAALRFIVDDWAQSLESLRAAQLPAAMITDPVGEILEERAP